MPKSHISSVDMKMKEITTTTFVSVSFWADCNEVVGRFMFVFITFVLLLYFILFLTILTALQRRILEFDMH